MFASQQFVEWVGGGGCDDKRKIQVFFKPQQNSKILLKLFCPIDVDARRFWVRM